MMLTIMKVKELGKKVYYAAKSKVFHIEGYQWNEY